MMNGSVFKFISTGEPHTHLTAWWFIARIAEIKSNVEYHGPYQLRIISNQEGRGIVMPVIKAKIIDAIDTHLQWACDNNKGRLLADELADTICQMICDGFGWHDYKYVKTDKNGLKGITSQDQFCLTCGKFNKSNCYNINRGSYETET